MEGSPESVGGVNQNNWKRINRTLGGILGICKEGPRWAGGLELCPVILIITAVR